MRKRPLAAQTDDDSFTTPDWNTTINYGALHVKRDSIKPASSLMKLPTLPRRQITGHKSLRAISALIYISVVRHHIDCRGILNL